MEILLNSKQNRQSERQHINIQIDIETHFFMEGIKSYQSGGIKKKLLKTEDLVKLVLAWMLHH